MSRDAQPNLPEPAMSNSDAALDDEMRAFVARTNAFYPPDAASLDIPAQRAVYDRMCAAFHAGRPAGVVARDLTIASAGGAIPARLYATGDAAPDRGFVVYFHGGGFVVGGLESHDDVCAELCAATGCELLSLDYRLSPEHIHPAAFDDALAGFEWAASRHGGRVVLCGDSAGANLAAAVAHATRRWRRPPAGQVLIYPGLGGDMSRGSYVAHADAPMLTRADVAFYARIRAGGADIADDPTFAPLRDTDFSGLPPSVIFSAGCDPLCDDGRDYRDAIVAAGGRAAWSCEAGLPHGYLRARHCAARARASFARIAAALGALAQGRWAG